MGIVIISGNMIYIFKRSNGGNSTSSHITSSHIIPPHLAVMSQENMREDLLTEQNSTDGTTVVGSEESVGGFVAAPTLYPVFRKRFHIPSRWSGCDAFRELAEHRYEREEHAAAFDFIEARLKSLNYHSDNKSMVHDYLHFIICDMLDACHVAYLTEEDVRNAPSLQLVLGNKTPDLIVERPEMVPIALDVFVGDKSETVDSKKEKYKGLSLVMEFDVITFSHLRPLSSVLSQVDLKYIQDQLAVFMTEYQYWHACLKLKKILFNNCENVPIRPSAPVSAEDTAKKLKLAARLDNVSQILEQFKQGKE